MQEKLENNFVNKGQKIKLLQFGFLSVTSIGAQNVGSFRFN